MRPRIPSKLRNLSKKTKRIAINCEEVSQLFVNGDGGDYWGEILSLIVTNLAFPGSAFPQQRTLMIWSSVQCNFQIELTSLFQRLLHRGQLF